MTPVRVYVAGPYSADPDGCTRAAITVGDQLADAGYAPYVPHLSHFWDAQHPRGYEQWMALHLPWVEAADVVLRIPGVSAGADREVTHARRCGVPVVYSVAELEAWRQARANITKEPR